ncbi:hypothetical protein ACFXGA_06215 [Actinosynnema sp. NPDC059335]|uniref:hypothetical protein n=1 Tax=Actinosynnema sp. NPDC059335 TaxID=3346804 RepID=UPI003672B1A4
MNQRAAEKAIKAITGLVWTDAVIVMVISATTTASLLASPSIGGSWTQGFFLGLAIDLGLAAGLIGDQAVQGLGQKSGWGAALRWVTAGMSLVTNCAASALASQWLGVALHAIPPVLLVVLTEAAQQYRTALATVQHKRAEEQQRAEARRVAQQPKPAPVAPQAPAQPVAPVSKPDVPKRPMPRAATVTELHPEQGTKKDRGRAWLIKQVVEHHRDPQQISAAEVDRAIDASGYSKKFIDGWRADAVAAKQAALVAATS